MPCEFNVEFAPTTTELNADFNQQFVGGSSDYNDLTNKPSINGVELSNNTTASNLRLAESSYIKQWDHTIDDQGFDAYAHMYVSLMNVAPDQPPIIFHSYDTDEYDTLRVCGINQMPPNHFEHGRYDWTGALIDGTTKEQYRTKLLEIAPYTDYTLKLFGANDKVETIFYFDADKNFISAEQASIPAADLDYTFFYCLEDNVRYVGFNFLTPFQNPRMMLSVGFELRRWAEYQPAVPVKRLDMGDNGWNYEIPAYSPVTYLVDGNYMFYGGACEYYRDNNIINPYNIENGNISSFSKDADEDTTFLPLGAMTLPAYERSFIIKFPETGVPYTSTYYLSQYDPSIFEWSGTDIFLGEHSFTGKRERLYVKITKGFNGVYRELIYAWNDEPLKIKPIEGDVNIQYYPYLPTLFLRGTIPQHTSITGKEEPYYG